MHQYLSVIPLLSGPGNQHQHVSLMSRMPPSSNLPPSTDGDAFSPPTPFPLTFKDYPLYHWPQQLI